MDYKVEQTGSDLNVTINQPGDATPTLLEAFGQCKDGQCGCPTDEYKKIADLAVEPGQEALELRLKARPGRSWDLGQVRVCLDWILDRARRKQRATSAE
jgi:hypothetical protein